MTPEPQLPLVTAIVPTYNAAGFVGATLDSLANQTWPRLEILIGDDGSTDATVALLEAFAAAHENVRLLPRAHNLGWLRNSNDLMANADGRVDVLRLPRRHRRADATSRSSSPPFGRDPRWSWPSAT